MRQFALPTRPPRTRWMGVLAVAVSVAACIVLACGGSNSTAVAPVATPTPVPTTTPTPASDPWSFAASPAAAAGLDTVSEVEIRDSVFYLASEALAGRAAGQGGDRLAADFIAQHFAEYGLLPGHGTEYLQEFDTTAGRTVNVLGYLPGTDPTRSSDVIVIGAHFDHLGTTGTSYYPGADDNASGTSALIEAAEAFARLRGSLPRTIVFAGFSGEELGLDGSRYYMTDPTFPVAQTVYMVNMDMIGHLQQGHLHFVGASVASSSQQSLIQEVTGRYPGVIADLDPYMGGSDHVPFRAAGIPFVLPHTGITSTYHEVNDTADSLEYPGLTTVTKIAIELTWRIANGTRAAGASPLPPLLSPGPELDHGVRPFLAPPALNADPQGTR